MSVAGLEYQRVRGCANSEVMKYTLSPSPRAKALAQELSVRDAINQVCCPLLNFEATETLGGAHISRGSREKVQAQIEKLRSVCKIPPLCTADLECGAGRAVLGLTEFPDLMGLGANDSEELAYAVGKATALEGRSVGLNWTFSPCVDVAEVADSPAVSTRSAGRTVERVIKTARGYLRGLQDHGMIATLKHFPGDGYTTYDQHLTTVAIPLTLTEWWRGPGHVYRELILAGGEDNHGWPHLIAGLRHQGREARLIPARDPLSASARGFTQG